MPGLHKKTKSIVSLRAAQLNGKETASPSNTTPIVETEQPRLQPNMKKSKSSTSLSALLSRKSSRGRRDKENQPPINNIDQDEIAETHWTQHPAFRPLQDASHTQPRPSPTRQRRTFEEEVTLYTPAPQLSPSKQRNFQDYFTPTLAAPADSTNPGFTLPTAQPIRKTSDEKRAQSREQKGGIFSSRRRPGHERSQSSTAIPVVQPRDRSRGRGIEPRSPKKEPASPLKEQREQKEVKKTDRSKRGSLVMAAISMFDSRSAAAEKPTPPAPGQTPEELEKEFEDLLEARNIPQDTRSKMRTMDTKIKADFIRQNRMEHSTSSTAATASGNGSTRSNPQDKDTTRGSTRRSKSRPRSWNFTLSKGDISPIKKQKGDGTIGHGRGRSIEIPRNSLQNLGPMSPAIQTDVSADPEDFVHYLREVQKPELVEVGKLHKLRILLRNEKVAWVDSFISSGGMDEVVELIYRIIKVEWREEHEDNLLHETLLCLKALSTTSLALSRLDQAGSTLFPALIGMLFDEEKKGPSEFTTRGIIMSILFTHLSTAAPEARAERARTILSYLRDPTPPEENRPINFIAEIYQPRPYRVWSKEISNVTKEVFWIFLHHVNVIPIVDRDIKDLSSSEYYNAYFPPPRPPVPAAPYVGGVEWDATNYLATHLDVTNGLIASLATANERNALREEFKVSGFEKVMGATLRTCKEKFYGAVHEGLKTWVAAAAADGWTFKFVREGPPPEERGRSPIKLKGSPVKKVELSPPKLDVPIPLKLDFERSPTEGEGWL